MIATYAPLLMMALAAALVVAVLLGLSHVLGPKRPSEVKGQPFETGSVPIGSPRRRFAVQFSLIAILFLIFDVEVIFFYPWAVMAKKLGLFGFVEMLVFTVFLIVGLVYAWGKGALDWD